jgi:hypothetical protein
MTLVRRRPLDKDEGPGVFRCAPCGVTLCQSSNTTAVLHYLGIHNWHTT